MKHYLLKALTISTLSVCFASTSFAAAYIKLGDIKGETTDRQHDDWIDLLSISQLNSDKCPSPDNVNVQRDGIIKIRKRIDKSSPLLMRAVCGGSSIEEAQLHIHNPQKKEPYISYEISNIRLSDYSIGSDVDDDGDVVPVEEFSLNYSEVKWSYEEKGHNERRKAKKKH